MSIIQGTSKAAVGAAYEIEQSIRFNDNDSAHLYTTGFSASPTSTTTCTFSTWVKRGNLGGSQSIFYGGNPAGSTAERIRFNSDNTILINQASSSYSLTTTPLFRDSSAWYHIVVVWDTSNGTSGDRIRTYINGIRVTSFSSATYPSLNYATNMTAGGASIAHVLGATGYAGSGSNSQHFDGYQAEINFIDGTALDPTSFGETNSDGVWIPKAYTGSYGTNGFYITGADSADLGADDSGNGNDFTSSGLATTDQMLDTPTDNFCTLNPLYKDSAVVLSDGNLTATSASSNRVSMSTFAVNSGKWYWEMTFTGTMTGAVYGIGKHPVTLNNYLGIDQYGWSVLGGYSGAKLTNNSGGGFGETYKGSNVLSGETVACALDMDTGKVYWGSDGTTDGTGTFAWYASGDPVAGTNFAFSGLTGDIYPACDADSRGTMVVNFGQSPFRYSADIPTNFNALSTANLTDTTITTSGTFTGNASADGPFVYLNGVPTAMTINGNSVTFATHADKLANGFKVRTSSSSYNASGSNSYSISTTGAAFADNANAQGNP